MTTTDTRSAKVGPASVDDSPTGSDSLCVHPIRAPHITGDAEGNSSPQAKPVAATMALPPAGSTTALPAKLRPLPNERSPEGHKNGHGHPLSEAHGEVAVVTSLPGGQDSIETQSVRAAGESDPGRLAITPFATPMPGPSLADPFLALSADVLDDLEKVRIANENRFRQLTRTEEDADGETRGFGLDESHPDVARLGALVDMLGDAEHKAILNLARLMRRHPLGPWMAAQPGIGEKQGARLLAAIGDPYVRPEIVREDGTVEPSRPRMVSELWALCGYHVIRTSVSGHSNTATQPVSAAGGADFPAGQTCIEAHTSSAGGEQNGHPGPVSPEAHIRSAGVAPKRARGVKANWSATAKMRAYLIATSCVKQPKGTRYRDVYDVTRAKYAEAVHQVECVRCGPSGKPALPGSPLSDGHKHARALRAIAKEVLRDLWREAKRLHEDGAE